MRRCVFFQLPLLTILLISCSSDPLEIDVSDVELTLESHRFDEDLARTSNQPDDQSIQVLYQNYGHFTDQYFDFILQLGPGTDSLTLSEYHRIRATDTLIMTLESQIEQVHSENVDAYSSSIEDAFKHYRYYFPEEYIPEVYYYNSWLNFAVFPSDSILGIGLDFFLGPENEVVKYLPPAKFPQYFRNKMRPDYVVSDAMRGWLMVKYQDYLSHKDLLSHLIWYGKMMYLTEATLPSSEDSVLINYSSREWEWCQEREASIWKELAKQEILYENKRFEISKWFADGPFTNVGAVPQDSPSRLGIYMGWQIIRDYMNENETVSIPQLLEEDDNLLLIKSYNPRN